MAKITLRALRAANWQLVYSFATRKVKVEAHACESYPEIISVHSRRDGGPTRITYGVAGRVVNSPSEAVRVYNARRSKHNTAGSPESLAAAKAEMR
jgi:hypothetical protein